MAEAAQPVRLGPSAHPRPSPGRGWSSPSSPAPALSVMASALARGSSRRDERPVSGVSLPSAKAPSPKGQRQRRHSLGLPVSLRLSHPEATRVQEEREPEAVGGWASGLAHPDLLGPLAAHP